MAGLPSYSSFSGLLSTLLSFQTWKSIAFHFLLVFNAPEQTAFYYGIERTIDDSDTLNPLVPRAPRSRSPPAPPPPPCDPSTPPTPGIPSHSPLYERQDP